MSDDAWELDEYTRTDMANAYQRGVDDTIEKIATWLESELKARNATEPSSAKWTGMQVAAIHYCTEAIRLKEWEQ